MSDTLKRVQYIGETRSQRETHLPYLSWLECLETLFNLHYYIRLIVGDGRVSSLLLFRYVFGLTRKKIKSRHRKRRVE